MSNPTSPSTVATAVDGIPQVQTMFTEPQDSQEDLLQEEPVPENHDTDVTGGSQIVKVLFAGNDIHTGHEVGLWPDEGFVLQDGTTRSLNGAQRYFLDCFRQVVREAEQERPDILVINGDLLDGEQRHSMGKEAASNLVVAQQKAATRLLEPLVATARETYIMRGTPYHDGPRGMDVEPVAADLGAVGRYPDWRTWALLDLRVRESVVINIQHAISVASGFYRATPLDREGIYSALAGKEGKVPRADVVARAHAHVFVRVEHPTKHIFITPCWQGQTEYMRRHSAYRMIPDIGAILMLIDPREKAAGRDPVVGFKKYLFPHPEVKAWDSQV